MGINELFSNIHLRRCVVIILSFLVTLPVCSQSAFLPGGYQHVVSVANYPNYGKGYLTITDQGLIEYSKDNTNWTKEYITHEYVDVDEENKLTCGSLILEVDGVSAKGWTAEKFYNKVDGRKDVITLKIRKRIFPEGIRDFETKIRVRYDMNNDLLVYGNAFANHLGMTFLQKRYGSLLSDVIYNEHVDDNYDFFYCMFYDVKTSDDDPLLDKELVKLMDLLEYNPDKADVVFRVKKNHNVNQKTEYVPPTFRKEYQMVNGVQTSYQKMVNPGYNRTVNAIDTYLEISAYDVKAKITDSSDKFPVVWTTVAERHTNNGAYSPINDLKAYASWMTMPIADKRVNVDRKMYAPLGITVDDDPLVIQEVIAGSRAEKIGLQPGDMLHKVSLRKPSNLSGYQNKEFKRRIKEHGWNTFVDSHIGSGTNLELDSYYYDIEFIRNGKKMKIQLNPKSIYVKRSYYVN